MEVQCSSCEKRASRPIKMHLVTSTIADQLHLEHFFALFG